MSDSADTFGKGATKTQLNSSVPRKQVLRRVLQGDTEDKSIKRDIRDYARYREVLDEHARGEAARSGRARESAQVRAPF